MTDGYNKIFWGLFFSTFHINLGAIEILPSFIAMLIVGSGIKEIISSCNKESFAKSLKYVYIQSGILFISFIFPFLTGRGMGESIILEIIWTNMVVILEILFISKLIEGSMEFLRERNFKNYELRYKNKARNFILIFTMLIILNNFNYIFVNDILGIFIPIIMIIVKVSMMFSIKNLGRIKWSFLNERI